MSEPREICESLLRYLFADVVRMGSGGFAAIGRGAVCLGFDAGDGLSDGYLSAGELVRRRVGRELVGELARYDPAVEVVLLFRDGAGSAGMVKLRMSGPELAMGD